LERVTLPLTLVRWPVEPMGIRILTEVKTPARVMFAR
jgi:hypothetical protein